MIKLINQVVAFLLEIAMVIGIGYWGFYQGKTLLAKYLFAIVLPVIAITLWGFFAAPRAEYRIKFPQRIIFQFCLFLIVSILLYKTGNSKPAIWFGFISFINHIITYILNDNL